MSPIFNIAEAGKFIAFKSNYCIAIVHFLDDVFWCTARNTCTTVFGRIVYGLANGFCKMYVFRTRNGNFI